MEKASWSALEAEIRLEDLLTRKLNQIPVYQDMSVSLLDEIDFASIKKGSSQIFIEILDSQHKKIKITNEELLKIQDSLQISRNVGTIYQTYRQVIKKSYARESFEDEFELPIIVGVGNPLIAIIVHLLFVAVVISAVYYFFL
jgi:ASC-1-like (ASCH) protein